VGERCGQVRLPAITSVAKSLGADMVAPKVLQRCACDCAGPLEAFGNFRRWKLSETSGPSSQVPRAWTSAAAAARRDRRRSRALPACRQRAWPAAGMALARGPWGGCVSVLGRSCRPKPPESEAAMLTYGRRCGRACASPPTTACSSSPRAARHSRCAATSAAMPFLPLHRMLGPRVCVALDGSGTVSSTLSSCLILPF
jgi:hypothetical protein